MRERLIGANAHSGTSDPIWLRTCYDADFEPRYEELAEGAELFDWGGVDRAQVLDDPKLYAWDGPDELTNILNRIPGMCDSIQSNIEGDYEDYEDLIAQSDAPPRDGILEVERASDHVVTLLYVINREAIKEQLVKIMWLDAHGNVVWRNRITPCSIRLFRGGLMGGHTLMDAVGAYDDERNFEIQGASLET
jgi:hypothetical protein